MLHTQKYLALQKSVLEYIKTDSFPYDDDRQIILADKMSAGLSIWYL